MPKDFPPYSSAHSFYWRAKQNGIWEKMMKDLVEQSRIKMGRHTDLTHPEKKIALMAVNLLLTEAALALKALWWDRAAS